MGHLSAGLGVPNIDNHFNKIPFLGTRGTPGTPFSLHCRACERSENSRCAAEARPGGRGEKRALRRGRAVGKAGLAPQTRKIPYVFATGGWRRRHAIQMGLLMLVLNILDADASRAAYFISARTNLHKSAAVPARAWGPSLPQQCVYKRHGRWRNIFTERNRPIREHRCRAMKCH